MLAGEYAEDKGSVVSKETASSVAGFMWVSAGKARLFLVEKATRDGFV